MKFFLDTANLAEIREAVSWGVIDGVTTNPSLIAKEGAPDPRAHIREICELVSGPVSAEVVSTTAAEMIAEARELARIHPNVMVKIPCLVEGLKAIRVLSQEGIAINTTLVFTVPQAILAAKAGATVVSPFVGRLDDIGHSGMELIEQIREVFDNYEFETRILVASIRHPMHVVQAALIGADIVTLPFKVLEQLIKHPLTDIGLERFLKDWERAYKPVGSEGPRSG
ncbi:MAG: fructose-6-phosphate aldolase [Blastocatellia bacterium]|nr:fructose-6-phosphate aldolase [Blastocatellia bacterium]MCS7157079.1 fructose-6-phosphate aldolase [Blastocatellia bacterium]MCX7752280.1 fructose-6-phosphate aldolase [Blastocatellia bacterium]MDW8167772.1 fructose-6-phosphate aldolase [Acidobacteriota bacterium]MDW8256593.1 fructose-6-phosphate aldolase [Acidobacteriota bacterium]